MNVRHFRHTASSYLIIGSSSIFSHLVSAITTITKLLAVCSLKLCTCELFSSKFEIFRSDIIIHPTTHTHTHLNNLSKLLPFSHFQLGIYWKTNCVCATPNTFFFFLIMWIFIWYSLGFLFIRCGRWLNEVMFVTPLTNPVTLFLISSAKWTSIQFLPFTFIECACLWICLFCNMISSL
jgi:hypothetical protein